MSLTLTGAKIGIFQYPPPIKSTSWTNCLEIIDEQWCFADHHHFVNTASKLLLGPIN